MKAWQSAVQEMLDAQARWLRDWTGRLQVTSGSPTDLRKNVQQAQVLLFPPQTDLHRLLEAGKLYINGWKKSVTLRSSYQWPFLLRLCS